ncbi:MAG TPA: hypothetical protein VM536_13975, partial [Chloroflexia bacterium]|nr:hypothetical protein [Chloroflexia bacterium]
AWIKFGLGQPLVAMPLYWLGRGVAATLHADPGALTRFCVALLNQAVIPATALVLFLGARRRYGASISLALTATFLLATPAIPYSRLTFAEPLSGLLLLSAFLLVWLTGGERRGALPLTALRAPYLLAGLCLGLAVLVKPANAIYVPVPVLYCIWRAAWSVRWDIALSPMVWRRAATRRMLGGLALLGIGLGPGLLLTAAYNMLRYANPFVFGYEREGFTTPLAVGLYGLLASPGKGIMFFAPPVLLAPVALAAWWRSRDPLLHAEVVAIAAQAAIVLVFHALWSSWEGNIAWGPRLILPLVPLLLWPLGALAARPGWRRAWWGLAVIGFLVAVPGALVDQYYYFDVNHVYGAGTVAEAEMLFTPAWSQIVAHWRFLLSGTREAVLRPALAGMGLAPTWDLIVPGGLVAGVLLALVVGVRRAGALTTAVPSPLHAIGDGVPEGALVEPAPGLTALP